MSAAAQQRIGLELAGMFEITAFIGEGSMASVYRARHQGDPPEVAIKIMHPELALDATFVKRFQREAKAASRIQHRNTVGILGHGAEGGVLYLAMELLAGQDLFDILVRERRFSEARAARLMIQVCSALAAAHHEGIVHRDLKPENVMLIPDPEQPGADLVKVLDFGIAKLVDRETEEGEPDSGAPGSSMPESQLTRMGSIVGTPEYMSPEQCRGEQIDARSDVYACGVLLYQLVTGKQPFVGQSPIEIVLMHVDQPPVPPSTHVPGLHAGLEKAILTALGKWPAQRQQSANALGAELEAMLGELRVTSETKRSLTTKAADDVKAAELPGLPSGVTITAKQAHPPAEEEEEAAPATRRSMVGDAPTEKKPEPRQGAVSIEEPRVAEPKKQALAEPAPDSVPVSSEGPTIQPAPMAKQRPAPTPWFRDPIMLVAIALALGAAAFLARAFGR